MWSTKRDRHELRVVVARALELGEPLGPRHAHDQRLEARVARAVLQVHREHDEVLDAVARGAVGAEGARASAVKSGLREAAVGPARAGRSRRPSRYSAWCGKRGRERGDRAAMRPTCARAGRGRARAVDRAVGLPAAARSASTLAPSARPGRVVRRGDARAASARGARTPAPAAQCDEVQPQRRRGRARRCSRRRRGRSRRARRRGRRRARSRRPAARRAGDAEARRARCTRARRWRARASPAR